MISEEQLKSFLEAVKADQTLKHKLKAAADADAVVLIARENGFNISAEDLKIAKSQLSEKELEAVAGAAANNTDQVWCPDTVLPLC